MPAASPCPCEQISIHALREEGDPAGMLIVSVSLAFLSTPSARRATVSALSTFLVSVISIHALREEGDLRHSAAQAPQRISIHALREEGDRLPRRDEARCTHFYPRPPRGGRPFRLQLSCSRSCYFYPRPPRGGRLLHRRPETATAQISIHALREEGDEGSLQTRNYQDKFLSTPSARRATQTGNPHHDADSYFYPRPPRGGRRGQLADPELSGQISIHALREEGDSNRQSAS